MQTSQITKITIYLPGDGGYAKDAKLKAPSSLAVSPDDTLYVADLGNIRIRAVSRNKAHLSDTNMYEIASPADQELYQFTINGTHLHTLNLITRDYIYNFTYSGEGDVATITSSNGNSVHIRRDTSGLPLWVVVPGGQVYWLTIRLQPGSDDISWKHRTSSNQK